MKVLDLHCQLGHTFEGWFGSEQDFLDQCAGQQVQCPVCGDDHITKKLSAPRLNLIPHSQHHPVNRAHQQQGDPIQAQPQTPARSSAQLQPSHSSHAESAAMAKAWMELSEKLVANTVDVGAEFAEEARKIHYGETEARAIRGSTSMDEARALVEEGIDVMPLLLPEARKNTLQ